LRIAWIQAILGAVKRRNITWGVIGLPLVAATAMYAWNPFHSTTSDLRARIFGYTFYRVAGSHMEPAIRSGRIFLANAATLRNRDPGVGEIIVFEYPRDRTRTFIARVVGIGGSTFEMRAGVVHLNGEPQQETYLRSEIQKELMAMGLKPLDPPPDLNANFPATPIPEHHLFVLGDNRRDSNDSRTWGFVPRENVIGVYTRTIL
jgi:signal peptidase I